MTRTLVLTLTVAVGAALMGASSFGAFGVRVSAQSPPASPIVATPDSTELLTTDFGTARILAGGEQTNGAFTVIEAVMNAGHQVTAHQHAFAESFYIVEGTLTVEVNGETQRVGAGSYVFVPGGVRHAISNREATRVRNIVSTTPAALERMFRRRAEELRQGNTAGKP